MEYLVGIGLALGVSVFGTVVGFDRQRGFYPVVLMVVASYYGLFAVMGGGGRALAAECGIIGLFVVAAVVGFKGSLWVVVGGLVAHGVLDCFHGRVVENAGVPGWWPMFCMTYDCTAGVYLAGLLLRSKGRVV